MASGSIGEPDNDAGITPEQSDVDLERGGKVLSSLGGASLTQMLLLIDTNPALAAIAGAAAAPAVSIAFDAVLRRRRERVEIASTEACRTGNCTFQDIVNAAVGSDLKIELLATALNAAAVADDERRVRALGVALARGVLQSDDALVDEQVVITRVLADLEAPDVRILHLMVEVNQTGFMVRTSRPTDDGTLVALVPTLAPVIDSIVARLSGLGTISSDVYGKSSQVVWSATSIGRQCIAALLQHDSDSGTPV